MHVVGGSGGGVVRAGRVDVSIVRLPVDQGGLDRSVLTCQYCPIMSS